jgi:hypothetical protein
MWFVVSVILIVACIVVMIFGIKILKDTRKIKPKDDMDEDEIIFRP